MQTKLYRSWEQVKGNEWYPSHLYIFSPWSHSLTVNWSRHSSNDEASPLISTVKSIIFSHWFEILLQFVQITCKVLTWWKSNINQVLTKLRSITLIHIEFPIHITTLFFFRKGGEWRKKPKLRSKLEKHNVEENCLLNPKIQYINAK